MKNLIRKPLVSLMILAGIMITGISCSQVPIKAANAEIQKESVVLLHGLGRSQTAMWLMASRLEDADYQVHLIDYDSFQESPEDIIKSVTRDIQACCSNTYGNLHFVGHSLGGLIIRAYLENYKPNNLGNVVLIGTPNQGTEFVDKYKDKWWMKFAGEAALALGTGPESFPKSLPKPDYRLGIIAGLSKSRIMDKLIPGADDGLVPVHSTPVEGMNDFLLVESGHSAMRYDRTVAAQTINYLKNGEFKH